ncbi:glycoside hydrolase family 3 protein [Rhodobacter sp. NTK016B]|uniref:glycoside hydrolase family 3 N-terminal domain-containing protein n=2 Tax=Bacteria TaxID=2 RepID=UPI001A8CA9DA|nr:glycoside hydrolase family 3 protein [Rhodobacter sp. NTK016B]
MSFTTALQRLSKVTFRAPGGLRTRARTLWRGARALFGFGLATLTYPVAWFGLFRPRDALADAVAELLVIGFYGATARSPSARLLARQVRRGQVGGVFFVAQNVGAIDELTGLMRLFRDDRLQTLIAIDHEGGKVQRLKKLSGLTKLPAAQIVAERLSPPEAQRLYAKAGQDLAALGFNVNLGPVLDIHDPDNPVIGKPKRAYGTDPDCIAAYAAAFVSGFASAGILCSAKHFPGHGRSVSDSHHGVADISAHWTEAELAPFARLFASAHPPAMVMMGHLRLDRLSTHGRPATLSAPIVTGLLRGTLGYAGVVITDDIDMDAIRHQMGRRCAVVRALAAGNDLIMIKNLFGYDTLLPQRAVRWVRKAINQGTLTETQIMAAAARVRAMRIQMSAKAAGCENLPGDAHR